MPKKSSSSRFTPSRRSFFTVAAGAGAFGAVAGAPAANALEPTAENQTKGIVNSLQFGDPSMRDQDRLQAAIDYYAAAKQEVTITISRVFPITKPIRIDSSYVSLDIVCGALTVNGSFVAFDITASSTSGFPNVRAGIRGLRLVGPGAAAAGSVGIRFNSENIDTGVRGYTFWGLEVSGFETGLSFENNTFLLSFYSYHIYRCKVCVSMPAGKMNYGENIKFIGGALGTSDLAIYNANPNGELNFVATSIDFCAQAIKADAGRVFMIQPHIEVNNVGANSPLSQFVTGKNTSAQISLTEGHLMFQVPPLAANYIFETQAGGWGGGILVNQMSFYNTKTKSGYLAGGTGKVKFDQIVPNDGNGSGSNQGNILSAKTANKLADGNFSLGSTVVEAFINSSDAVDRVSSATVQLSIVDKKLRMKKIGTKTSPTSVAFDVPVKAGLLYASDFTINSTTATGILYCIESFVNIAGYDAKGLPRVIRSDARTPSNIDLTSLVGKGPLRKTFPQTSWNRMAPAWATHFRIRFTFGNVNAGDIDFLEMILTET